MQTSTKQTNTRPNKKTAEGAENIAAIRLSQNILNGVPAISSQVVSLRKSLGLSMLARLSYEVGQRKSGTIRG